MKNFIRLFLIFTVLVTILSCDKNEARKPPNVVIIFIDDMGYGDLSCYGNVAVKTPNMDALASQGVRFTNFYVNSPICSPSRVALNTGTYPMRHKIHSYIASSTQNRNRAMADFLDPSVMTIARTLSNNGYATGHFGKWHMGGGRDLGDVPYPTDYGFDKSFVAFEGIGDRLLFPNHGLSNQSEKLGNGEIVWAPKHASTSIYIDSALTFVRNCKEQPFYINLCPNDVHDPHLPELSSVEKWRSATENPYEQKFFAVLEELDNQIGRLVSELDKIGKLENTIIIFASDNGPTDWPYYYNSERYPEDYTGKLYAPGFTGGLSGRKWSLFEGGIREPFFVYWKGHFPADKVDEKTIVSAIDIFPSLCSLLGIEIPEDIDGTDKSQAFGGTEMEDVPAIMWEYASNPGGSILPGNKKNISPNLAIRQGNWKLLINADSTDIMLFNLEKDPGEKLNLAAQNTELAGEMVAQILAWRRSMPVDVSDNKGE
ncbi:sulfatase family protein [Maribellus comscasis]|nr:sulfatase-like hydrolase/transferase [Maribellus comscasis]